MLFESLLSSSIGKAGSELLSKLKEHQHVRDLLERCKRRIRATRISNNLFAELHTLRDLFLQYGLAEKSEANRSFFDKWLTHPVIEMGWTPSGGWTLQRISELHADLEAIAI